MEFGTYISLQLDMQYTIQPLVDDEIMLLTTINVQSSLKNITCICLNEIFNSLLTFYINGCQNGR